VTVAVIIPCYRERLDRVVPTIESAWAVPSVTDVVVVIDGDGGVTAADVGPLCDFVTLPENRGCSAALNAGIRSLSGDPVICRLDVGDVFYPEAKERQIQTVLSGDCDASMSHHFDPVAGADWKVADGWERALYRDSQFTGCTTVYRKSVWSAPGVGTMDESFRYKEDWYFAIRVQHYVGWSRFDEVTCSAGMFPDGFSARAQLDPVTAARRKADNRRVAEAARRLQNNTPRYWDKRRKEWV
jgi:glycosyltransferase involved in cell wall biosynthesis